MLRKRLNWRRGLSRIAAAMILACRAATPLNASGTAVFHPGKHSTVSICWGQEALGFAGALRPQGSHNLNSRAARAVRKLLPDFSSSSSSNAHNRLRLADSYLRTGDTSVLGSLLLDMEAEPVEHRAAVAGVSGASTGAPSAHHDLRGPADEIYGLFGALYPDWAARVEASGESLTDIAVEVLSNESRLSLYEMGLAPALGQMVLHQYKGPRDPQALLGFLGGLQRILDCQQVPRGSAAHEWVGLVARNGAKRRYEEDRRRRQKGSRWPANPVKGERIDLASGVYFADFIPFLDPQSHYTVIDLNPFVAEYLRELARLHRVSNLTIEEGDLLAAARPHRPVAQIRAMNIFSYVNGSAPKIFEMMEWLAPGGELLLGAYVGQPQAKEVTLQRFGAAIRARLAEGWRLTYRRSVEATHDMLVLQKPGPHPSPGTETASEAALVEFIKDSASWTAQADKVILAMARKQDIRLHYDSVVGLYITDNAEEGNLVARLFAHTLGVLFGDSFHMTLLPQAIDPQSAQASLHVESIEAVIRTNAHLIGAFMSPSWVGRFFSETGEPSPRERVRYAVKTGPKRLESISVDDEAVFLREVGGGEALSERSLFLFRMAEYMRHWAEQLLPHRLDADFLEAAHKVMSDFLGPTWTPSPQEKSIHPVSA